MNKSIERKRVVVTAAGCVTPLGSELESFWQAVCRGDSGIVAADHLDMSQLRSKICGRVRGFDADTYFSPKEQRKMDPFIQYALAASDQAIASSGCIDGADLSRIGVCIGSGIGGLSYIENNHTTLMEQGAPRISPFFIPSTIINMAAGMVSIRYGLQGPNLAMVTACTTGAHAIGYAARTIVYGDADVMICGGAEHASVMLGMGGFAALKALSTQFNDTPEQASRPWDRDRDGFVLSDGAGILVLEELEHARARGAHIIGELVGFGMSADGFHMTQPDPSGQGAYRSMQNALSDGGVSPDEVDYINAHATSTPLGDQIEPLAIRKLFSEHADQLAVSGTKSMTGHMLGAAGAVEAIITVLALRDQIAPPTINCDHPGEGCDLNFVTNGAEKRKMRYAMSNSFGFGGTNGSLLFKHVEDGTS